MAYCPGSSLPVDVLAGAETVAFAVTAFDVEQRHCRHETSSHPPRYHRPLRVRRFPPPRDVSVVAVRWYLRLGMSYRDVEEPLVERGGCESSISPSTTVYCWVQRFTPLLVDAARPCRHAVGDRWGWAETCVKVVGHWRCVYRAIDQFGQVIDVY